ncbi:MAG: hypothetical protein GY778_00500, partial [bacterium]|nr:hypothetical protein [bacterium]
EDRARTVVERRKQFGLAGACRLADFGLHVYYNIPALVDKVPLSPFGF